MKLTRVTSVLVAIMCTWSCTAVKDKDYIILFDREFKQIKGHIGKVIADNERSAMVAAEILSRPPDRCKYPRSIYSFNELKVLADYSHVAKTNIYLPANVRVTSKTWDVICATEHLEETWMAVESRYPKMGWQYITEAETKVTRTYPWLDEVAYMGPYVDYTTVPQWTLVMPSNNPGRESKCTNVYFDHDGLGYVVTCVAPIYQEDRFIGNMSIDMPIGTFFTNIVSEYDGNSKACSLIVDSSGALITQVHGSGTMLCAATFAGDKLAKGDPLMKCVQADCKCDGKTFNDIDTMGKRKRIICDQIEPMKAHFVLMYEP